MLLFLLTYVFLSSFSFIRSLNLSFPHIYLFPSSNGSSFLLLTGPPQTSSSTFVDEQKPYVMNTCSFEFAHALAQLLSGDRDRNHFIIFLLSPLPLSRS